MFLVWTDEERTSFRRFDSLMDAVTFANDGGHLVTEVVPLGDPRLLMVESLAYGGKEYFGGIGATAIKQVEKNARHAMKEASTFDLQRGSTTGVVGGV